MSECRFVSDVARNLSFLVCQTRCGGSNAPQLLKRPGYLIFLMLMKHGHASTVSEYT